MGGPYHCAVVDCPTTRAHAGQNEGQQCGGCSFSFDLPFSDVCLSWPVEVPWGPVIQGSSAVRCNIL